MDSPHAHINVAHRLNKRLRHYIRRSTTQHVPQNYQIQPQLVY